MTVTGLEVSGSELDRFERRLVKAYESELKRSTSPDSKVSTCILGQEDWDCFMAMLAIGLGLDAGTLSRGEEVEYDGIRFIRSRSGSGMMFSLR